MASVIIIYIFAFLILALFVYLNSPSSGNYSRSKSKRDERKTIKSNTDSLNNFDTSIQASSNETNLFKRSNLNSDSNYVRYNDHKKVNPDLALFGIKYLYHMTHISNLTNIIKLGLVSNNLAHSSNIISKDISDPGVQVRRNRTDPIYNKSIHSYVPLYFNPRNPMLYVRKNIQKDILLLVFDAHYIFNNSGVIYSDGNAASKATRFYLSLTELSNLDWSCIYKASYWNDFKDGKRKRCAEVLVPNKIEYNKVKKILVYDFNIVRKVKEQLKNNRIEVLNDSQFFF